MPELRPLQYSLVQDSRKPKLTRLKNKITAKTQDTESPALTAYWEKGDTDSLYEIDAENSTV